MGERVVVIGLGLIGLLTVQMLRANGCRVLGVDLDSEKCALAASFGATVCDVSKGQDAVAVAAEFSGGKGVDGVMITASAKTDQIVHDAATMCRKRGRIVLVGVVGLKLQREDFYKKELSFQVSCSYGPGRYDPLYEGKGYDYPEAYVRWTEQRNFEAVLGLMAEGKLVTGPLVSHRFPFEKALEADEVVGGGKALGIVLEYGPRETLKTETLKTETLKTEIGEKEGRRERPRETLNSERLKSEIELGEPRLAGSIQATSNPKLARQVDHNPPPPVRTAVNHVRLSVIGAGNFTTRTLLPAMKGLPVRRRMIAS